MHPVSLLLRGDSDTIVPADQIGDLTARKRIRIVVGARHFDWLHPQTQAFTELLSIWTQH
ncbi:MAG: hypothetical protein OXE78_14425 [Gammaproteobacteria bacterium]|nr:hypothetical protein [Gammaproteobacteria bacterium]MCY4356806.1 hypothetical protein [Gammaproteobacteria bacterium]